MDNASARGPLWRAGPIVGAVGVVVLALALRLPLLDGLSLWYDELLSVTHAYRPFPISILSSVAHDKHPPLYNLLLSGWLLLGTDDGTIILSSVLTSVAAAGSILYCAGRMFGPKVGLLAGLVFAIHPYAIYWSVFARMYSLIFVLVVWVFYLNYRVTSDGGSRTGRLALVVIQVALVYSHSGGFFFCATVVAAVVAMNGIGSLSRRWITLQVVAILFAIPALYFPLVSRLAHLEVPELTDLVSTAAQFVTGPKPPRHWMNWVGGVTFLVTLAALVAERRTRRPALVLFVVPFAVAAVVSYSVRPVWHAERLFAFLLPPYCVALAALLFAPYRTSHWMGKIVAAIAAAAILASAVSSAMVLPRFSKPGRFIDAAALVGEGHRPGDTVAVLDTFSAWAFNWYFLGPGWDANLPKPPAGIDGVPNWSRYLRQLQKFDRQDRFSVIRIVQVRRHRSLVNEPRVWLVALTRDQLKSLEANTGLAGKASVLLSTPMISLSKYERDRTPLQAPRSP